MKQRAQQLKEHKHEISGHGCFGPTAGPLTLKHMKTMNYTVSF
jgi:hypothetical protein